MAKRQIKNLRWVIASLVFLNTVNNYIDRQTLSVLAPQITGELNLNNIEYAQVVQAFLVAYTVMYVFAGIAVDRWGVKLAYGAATAWWSVAAMLHATIDSAFSLGAFRFLLGIGESFNFISAEKVAAEWYPPKDRAMLNGVANAAAVTGAIITPPVVVWIALQWGWRTAFLVTGSLGFFWLIAWVILYHLPERHPRITPTELKMIREEQALASTVAPGVSEPKPRWVDLLKFRQTWGLLLARVFSDPVWWFYLFWLPKYLTESRGLTLAEMGMVVWVPYLAADAGSVAGGWLSGRLIRNGWEVLRARRMVMLASAAMMPLGILVSFMPRSGGALFIICLVLFAHMSWKTNLMTLTVDVFPRPVVASVAGIVGTGSGAGAALFTSVVGYLIQTYSYAPVFWIMAFMHPIAYLFTKWLVRGKAARSPQLAADPSLVAR